MTLSQHDVGEALPDRERNSNGAELRLQAKGPQKRTRGKLQKVRHGFDALQRLCHTREQKQHFPCFLAKEAQRTEMSAKEARVRADERRGDSSSEASKEIWGR